MRIRYFPRSQKFKFMFNKKIKISRLNYTKNSFSKNGQYNVKFTENCQLQYFQLKGLYHALLPYLKKGQLKL